VRRRRGHGEDGHHGGVWKIAYADFMTAMMAFFLVMWLINTADKQTIVQVAAYFNPIRLTDRVVSQRGLHEGTPRSGPNDKEFGSSQRSGEKEFPAPPINKAAKEGPVAPAGDQRGDRPGVSGTGGADARDALPGGSFGMSKGAPELRDPFDPSFRKVSPARPSDPLSEAPAPPPLPGTAEVGKAASDPVPPAAALHGTAQELEREIRRALAEAGAAGPNIELRVTPEGILISLTDDANFGMFAIASAEPRPELVVVMERIGAVLKSRPGPLIVRGHTDGRPYRSAHYDNWRLSSARAHAAYDMLVRGGVAEQRFERIEGHADRSLSVPADRQAAQNRRIEILLEAPRP
jgi:chemotaxis protein MotB